MVTHSAEFIQRRAISRSACSRVDFLKSREVAERVASDVRRSLAEDGYKNLDRRVVARKSVSYRGTYAVEVRIPGILRRYPGGQQADERDMTQVVAALKAAVKKDDLVTSWS